MAKERTRESEPDRAVITAAARKLKKFDPHRFRALVGLDGFIDQIIDVVDKRSSADKYTRVETIGALGERISRAAGLSSNLELVIKQVKLGGNGPIMANALITGGMRVTYLGLVGKGKDAIHPVFQDMAAKCEACYSLADPSVTLALEFRDGKLMQGLHQTLRECTYDRILEVVGLEKLREIWRTSHLIALTNWTMLPHQTDIWKRLLIDMKGIKPPEGAYLFIDLADPEKRETKELGEALKILKRFRGSHRVIFGVNQKESMEVSVALKLGLDAEAIEDNARKIRAALDLDAVVVHPTKSAACATEKDSAAIDGPFCANPKLTTGAGDNFNAGFCVGLLAGLEPRESLTAGVAASGFYVRNARSPTAAELSTFLDAWSKRHADANF